jgi:hypothetical protein
MLAVSTKSWELQFMAAGLAMVVLLISWLVTHPEAGHHREEPLVIGSR